MDSGQVIAGKYRLNQLLGTGGMASVWSATNVFTEREFAIKFMLPQVARTEEAARRFLMEAKASARINHPNIIEIIDVGTADDGALFLVMELLTGVSLETALRRQNPPMSVYEFSVVMLDVARALAAAHRSGVIHRDLKPTNIFMHRDRHGINVPKVLDFGVSKFLEDDPAKNHGLTVAGTVLGSPMYMSPEQAMGTATIDGRTDIFAFGSIFFEALVGHRCFDAPNFNALIVTIATKQPESIDANAPDAPESLRALVRECLVTDRNKRIASFDIVVDRLEQMLPELEKIAMRLPRPHAAAVGTPSDPDATNALPAIVRPSDRPPPPGFASASGIQVLPSPSGAWTPQRSPSYTSIPAPVLPASWRASSKKGPLILGAAALVAVAVLAAGFVVSRRTQPIARPLSAAAVDAPPVAMELQDTTPSTPATTANATSTPAPTEVQSTPVVSVDQLPVVATKSPAKGNGRLLVAASNGWCTLYVDGVSRGATPVSVDLPAGAHQLRCDPPSGKPMMASVTVAEGATAKHKF